MSAVADILKSLKSFWHGNPPVEGFEQIDEVETYLKAPLPADFKYFLQWYSNGGEGNLPEGYLQIFSVGEILCRQADYGFDKEAPLFLVFGLEGDHVFCFDLSIRRNTGDYPVVEIPLSCVDDDDDDDDDEIQKAGSNFVGFLENRLKDY